MSKIVFFCIPAHGHTNPTLGVVRELIARGHQLWYYSFEMFRDKIEASGAKFIPCDEFDAERKIAPKDVARLGSDLAFSTKLLVDTTLALDETVCRHMAEIRPDCIVADSMAVWGKAAAMKLGIPFVSSTTTFAFNKESAKLMKQSGGELLKMLLSMPKLSREVKRLNACGYPIKSVLELISNDNDTHTIVYTSPEFQPCAETFSDKYAFVGPVLRPAESEFIKRRDKLVYISMGTVNNDMLPLYKSCIEALGGSDYQLVISAGKSADISSLGSLPENVELYRHVDQIALLRKADVFISHCGMNSVGECLYFSVPLVMLPQTKEQQAVARRTEQLGAGLMLSDSSKTDISAAVEKVLAEPRYRNNAALIAESFRACGGAKAAADKILELSSSCCHEKCFVLLSLR